MAHKNGSQNSEYGELVDFIAQKIDGIDRQFDEIKEELKSKADKSDIDGLRSELSSRIAILGSKIDDNRGEQSSMERKVDAHEKLIAKASEKISVE
jgi:hypothetical protein